MSLFKVMSTSALGKNGAAAPIEFPLVNGEQFSANFGAWTTPGTELPENAWSRATGASPTGAASGPTGGSNPETRNPTGGNGYAFTPSDNGNTSYSLESPELDASQGTFTFLFDYHAHFGASGEFTDGTLQFQGWNGSAWVNIGQSIVGSQQLTDGASYLPSTAFGTFNSEGFSNSDFRARFLFTRGASAFLTVYPACVDNIDIFGPGGVINPPVPSIFPSPRFGGQFAPWAIPASEIATHPNSANLLNQVFALCPGRINMNFNKFTPVIFEEERDGINTTATFVKTDTKFGGSLPPGTVVPWNEPKFVTSFDLDPSDGDSYFVLVRQSDGRCYEWFRADYQPGPNNIRGARGTLLGNTIDETGGQANVFTKQNGNRDSRACGLQHSVGIPLRSAYDSGEGFRHTLAWAYPNPTQGAFEAPATKGAGLTGGGPNRGFMGLRIVWDGLTENDINTWLDGEPQVARTFLRFMAEAARDFGFMVTDNGGNASARIGNTQIEHNISARWEEDLGFGRSNIFQSLHRLLEPNRIGKTRALDLPTFVGGSSQNVACYPGIPYPQGHPCNP